MKIGTKSILFGAHQFLLHPLFVATAWWKLYGFPFDPRLWFCFFLHDVGYIGKPNMDGPQGKMHPWEVHFYIEALFGRKWADFCLYHSRSIAETYNAEVSPLCVADKYAFCITPRWLYLPMTKLTGEIDEYLDDSDYKECNPRDKLTYILWHSYVNRILHNWVMNNKDEVMARWQKTRQ